MDKENSENWISILNLEKHPEGGYYKEIYRCTETFKGDNFEGERNLCTSIYFLLRSNDVSKFHKLKSDELWYYHTGSSLTLFIISPEGQLTNVKLGLDINNGEMPQVIIPKESIFGAIVNNDKSFTLVGCVVAPGFNFRDFELFSSQQLLELYPQYKDVIHKLT